MAKYPCPQCGGKMFIEAVHEGYEVPCPHCSTKFRVPKGAAAEAEAVSDFLIGMFESSDPNLAKGKSLSARQLLDRGTERFLSDFPRVNGFLAPWQRRLRPGGFVDAHSPTSPVERCAGLLPRSREPLNSRFVT